MKSELIDVIDTDSDLSEIGEEAVDVDPHTPAGRIQHIKDVVDILLKIVLILAVLGGALEYFSTQKELRVRHSLTLVDDWEDQSYSLEYDRFRKVAEVLTTQSNEKYPGNHNATFRYVTKKFDTILRHETEYNSVVLDEAANSDSLPSYEAFVNSISRLNYFYGKLGLCVQDRICEPDLMGSYFGDSACDFMNVISHHISSTRARSKNANYALFSLAFCDQYRR